MIAWPDFELLKRLFRLFGFSFSMVDVYIIVSAVVIILLAVLSERHRTRKTILKEIEKFKKSQPGVQDYIVDIASISSRLNEIHEFVLKAPELRTRAALANSLLELSLKITKSASGAVMLIDPSKAELTVAAYRGLGDEAIVKIRANLSQSIAGGAITAGKPMLIENFEKAKNPAGQGAERLSNSFTAVPLKARDKLIGFISIVCPKDTRIFDEKDMMLLSLIADQTAILFENIGLYDNIQNFYFEIIQTLARTIDAKDSYTHDHADRARKYARLICNKLGMLEPQIKDIEYAAMVHDIGKIGIKEEILNKAGKLTHEEEEALRRHPQIGNRILEPVAFLASVAPIVLYHHEWYNGEGYPNGLEGEEIPLGSRIVSVIDAYDAMTSDRPYRKAFSREVAIKELVEGRATQFDPKVVDAFLEVLKDEKRI